jgi:hypothetical protein
VSPLPGKLWWPKRGKGPVEDREIRCVRCSWKTTDPARAISTSNMKLHLSKHGIFQSSSKDSREDNSSVRQQSIASILQKKAEMETKKNPRRRFASMDSHRRDGILKYRIAYISPDL